VGEYKIRYMIAIANREHRRRKCKEIWIKLETICK